MPPTAEGSGGSGGGLSSGRWGHKYGPLPLWAWGGLALGGALAISSWRKGKAAKTNTAGQPTTNESSPVSAYQVPPYVVINDLYTGSTMTPPTSGPPVSGGTTTPPPTGGTTTPPPTPPPVQTVTPPPAPAPAPAQPSQVAYKVQPGDSLSRIAAKFGVFGGNGLSLYNYNINSAGRSAQDIATLKSRGPNLIYAGETIYIPR